MKVNPFLSALLVPLSSLREDEKNARRHDEQNVAAIASSLSRFGQQKPIVALKDGRVIAGNGTLRAAAGLGWETIAVVQFDSEEEAAARAYAIADNRSAELAAWDLPDLTEALAALRLDGYGDALGFSDEDVAALQASLDGGVGKVSPEEARRSLASRFLVPPFSVLDSRQGYWRERKAAWLALGIQSEIGRGENLLRFSDTVLGKKKGDRPALEGARHRKERYDAAKRNAGLWRGGVRGKDPTFYAQKRAWETKEGRRISTEEFRTKHWVPKGYRGTSVFDPVLCELAYRWFCPAGGAALDPFAGGSVRGVVAGLLGRRYLGVDLRPEQVEANEAQAAAIFKGQKKGRPRPKWVVGDATELGKVVEAEERFDLVFSCPPYFDLERYSKDPRDLSNKPWDVFLGLYRDAIRDAVQRLRPDRFAVWVVGEIRGEVGFYRGFVPETVRAFETAGAHFYNEAVLVTAVASLAMRTPRQFEATRKLGKAHQTVLVFFKGNPKKIPRLDMGEGAALAEALKAADAGAVEP
jgi:ParB-like chromosome segregation protein Spo0J